MSSVQNRLANYAKNNSEKSYFGFRFRMIFMYDFHPRFCLTSKTPLHLTNATAIAGPTCWISPLTQVREAIYLGNGNSHLDTFPLL
jgi:hypothetical protein